ncbi:hypothetical protein [Microbacterium amylolyticum]|uniref:Mannose-6-phosphate isomerase class I n=1 Tax=Microbacterium amylolyticum TaxID=936337 RepID=A0ABS4ZIG1_9MICO|nr:hypothetical protein [Microbacterium amylolyticum]MBP2437052.1 mannose-6-phosphate isomerase class I [Microbacterium amylolyticum]
MGLKRDISKPDLLRLIEKQDTAALLDVLHEVPGRGGDVVFVPPGTLHAIGQGILLVEAQEPEDLSILVEWEGFDLDGSRHGHLGLGFDRAIDAIDLRGVAPADVSALVRRSELPAPAEEYFRMERVVCHSSATIGMGFAVLVVTVGEATLRPATGDPLRVTRGSTVLAPFAAGDIDVDGEGEILVVRPPRVG